MKLTEAMMDRACRVILGSAVGDALGAGYEFTSPAADLVPEMIGGGIGRFSPGEWADDTAQAAAIARVASNPNLDYVIDDAVRTIAAVSAEGQVVLVHCVAAHSRTPIVRQSLRDVARCTPERGYDSRLWRPPRSRHQPWPPSGAEPLRGHHRSENPMTFTLDDARAIAREAHAGQADQLGVDYMEHVEAVAAGLVDFDIEIQIAGLLHDTIEDSDLTFDDLWARGVPERAIRAIELVTRTPHPGLSYAEGIEQITTNNDATLVKISDHAHNSHPERVAALEVKKGQPTNPRYAAARPVLYPAVSPGDVTAILARVAPALLNESDS